MKIQNKDIIAIGRAYELIMEKEACKCNCKECKGKDCGNCSCKSCTNKKCKGFKH